MPYTRERLEHALEILRALWREQAEKAAEKAKLQYRDGFNLRHKPVSRGQAAKLWQDNSLDRDDDDDDYDPAPSNSRKRAACSARKSRCRGKDSRENKGKNKRRKSTGGIEVSQDDGFARQSSEENRDQEILMDITARRKDGGLNGPNSKDVTESTSACQDIHEFGTYHNPVLLSDDDDESDGDNTINNNIINVDELKLFTTTISTSFAHPMTFNQTKPPCEFCTDYRFALLGHGPAKDVTVTARGDSSCSYTELDGLDLGNEHDDNKNKTDENGGSKGGGYATSHTPTKMCRQCTHMRVMTIQCKIHSFAPIPNPAPNFDRATYTENLYSQAADRNRLLPGYIKNVCRFCVMPAMWRCNTQQSRTVRGEFVRLPDVPLDQQLEQIYRDFPQLVGGKINLLSAEKGRGCGLKLCEDCKDIFVDKFDAKLDPGRKEQLIKEIQRLGAEKKIRADFDFLFKDGLLWRSCCTKSASISKLG